MTRAGKRVRQLAHERRSTAWVYFLGASALAVAPIFVSLLLSPTPGLSMIIWIACWVGVIIRCKQGREWWIRANQADRGAEGEEDVARLLKPLEQQGWKIEFNLRLHHWGDADAFLSSPGGKYFVVDVKANKGGVFFDGSVLKRRYGKNVYEFQDGKDLLKAVKGQAKSLKDMKRIGFVQPILCFTLANLKEIKSNPEINGVYVVHSTELLSLLNRLNKN